MPQESHIRVLVRKSETRTRGSQSDLSQQLVIACHSGADGSFRFCTCGPGLHRHRQRLALGSSVPRLRISRPCLHPAFSQPSGCRVYARFREEAEINPGLK